MEIEEPKNAVGVAVLVVEGHKNVVGVAFLGWRGPKLQ